MGLFTARTGGIQAHLLALQSGDTQMRRELQEVRTNQMADRVTFTKCFSIMNAKNIRRIALQPGGRVNRGGTVGTGRVGDDDANGQEVEQPAVAGYHMAPPSLSPNPKNLFDLWQEYEIGIEQSYLLKKSVVDGISMNIAGGK